MTLEWSAIRFRTIKNNFDSGYKAQKQHNQFEFPTSNNTDQFNFWEFGIWTISSTTGAAVITVAQFTTTQATPVSNKPIPIFNVVSVAPKVGNSSNWMALASTPTMVPEPTNLALLGVGLMGLVIVRRRQARS